MRADVSTIADDSMTPGAIQHAIHQARYALDALAADVRLSDTQPRQRTLTKHVRDAMDAVDWVIDYNSTKCAQDA